MYDVQVNSARGRCLINPTSDTEVEEGDQLIMMRPTSIASKAYRPIANPVTVDVGEWSRTFTVLWQVFHKHRPSSQRHV